jgi:hypothetical protein
MSSAQRTIPVLATAFWEVFVFVTSAYQDPQAARRTRGEVPILVAFPRICIYSIYLYHCKAPHSIRSTTLRFIFRSYRMGVTELALLRLFDPKDLKDPFVLQTLRNVKLESEKFGAANAQYIQCPDDPALLWIVSGWPSVEQHVEKWIPSQENQDALAKLAEKIEVCFMFHLDVESQLVKVVLGSKVVRIGRYAVRKEGREGVEKTHGEDARQEFQRMFGEARGEVKKDTEVGGWRIDKGMVKEGEELGQGVGEVDEWVVFTGFEEENDALEANTAGWKGYAENVGLTGREDVKYGVVLEV